jgi:hypothetical protein
MQDPTSGASLPETSMRVRENELSTCGKDREVAGTIGESDIFIACHRLAKFIADGKERPSAPRLTRILLDLIPAGSYRRTTIASDGRRRDQDRAQLGGLDAELAWDLR